MMMAIYTVEAIKRVHLSTTVEADSLEEAQRLADEELIVDDFDEVGTDFTLTFLA
jgi:hypothetical protein